MELQGNKWVIVSPHLRDSALELTIGQEYQENERELVLEDVSISQIVTLYGCKNTTLQVKGKVNGISMSEYISNHLV